MPIDGNENIDFRGVEAYAKAEEQIKNENVTDW